MRNKDQQMFPRLYFELFGTIVSHCEYLKMVENHTSAEYNLDENSDSEGCKNEDIEDNASIVPDSDPCLLTLRFHQQDLVKFLVSRLIFGMNGMIMDVTLLVILLSLPMQTFLTGQLTSQT